MFKEVNTSLTLKSQSKHEIQCCIYGFQEVRRSLWMKWYDVMWWAQIVKFITLFRLNHRDWQYSCLLPLWRCWRRASRSWVKRTSVDRVRGLLFFFWFNKHQLVLSWSLKMTGASWVLASLAHHLQVDSPQYLWNSWGDILTLASTTRLQAATNLLPGQPERGLKLLHQVFLETLPDLIFC